MNIQQKKEKKTNTSADDFVNDCVKNHNSAGTRNPATTSLFTDTPSTAVPPFHASLQH